jgi:beta-glucoside operon transcriptional antiterminator
VDTTSNIRDMLKEDSRLALCINRIVKLIEDRYDYKLSPDEQTYLCIHIKKNMG